MSESVSSGERVSEWVVLESILILKLIRVEASTELVLS